MVNNYVARKYPETVTENEWWEEAQKKTPAQLDKAYPPLKPQEWYIATWSSSTPREFDSSHGSILGSGKREYRLKMFLWIRTEPNLVIKELYGHLKILKAGTVIYETPIEEKPDVSFKDRCIVLHVISPYDDTNEAHRTIRYGKDNELTPVFVASKVVLADGTQKTFESEP
jgi:hypothetical protein